jgi:hypothetical protein
MLTVSHLLIHCYKTQQLRTGIWVRELLTYARMGFDKHSNIMAHEAVYSCIDNNVS